ncbi:hypothetical protein EAF04_010118 [Stromatinia cepivora]|nr:hypothetical protein EAF04_010118 [Stromatinia cepivora]
MKQLVSVLAEILSFYVPFLYLIDFYLRGHHIDYTRPYVIFRFLIFLLFLVTNIVLLIIQSKEILSTFYYLQILILSLNFIIQIMMAWRSVLGNFAFQKFWEGPFPWVLSAAVLVVGGFICSGFALIFGGWNDHLSRVLCIVGIDLIYGFLGCLILVQLFRSGILHHTHKKAVAPMMVSVITFSAIPASALSLLLNNTARFLSSQTLLSSTVSTSWIVLVAYKRWKYRDDGDHHRGPESGSVH